MSDEQSDRVSAEGSSLSLFSGLGGGGTSSVSGTSESGGLPPNVDELSDSRLEQVVEDTKASLRVLMLETLMFETYYERLASGQVSLTPTQGYSDKDKASTVDKGSEGQSRKGSTSETDSQPATSLLEVSHRSGNAGASAGGGGTNLSRRRSGSRASLGSRVKSLRLTDEQKCGIASREVERIEHDLADFRMNSRRENRNGVAQIDEKTALLEELEKRKVQLTKGLLSCRTRKSGRREEYNSKMVNELFLTEEAALVKHGERLKNRNGVLSSQIVRMRERLRTDASAAEEGGPVDMDQLRLENAQSFAELERRNASVVELREKVARARKRRFALQDKLKEEEGKGKKLEDNLKSLETTLNRLETSLPNLEKTLSRQTSNLDQLRKGKRLGVNLHPSPSAVETNLAKSSEIPTVDDYFRLKVEQEKLKTRLKVEERRKYLRELAWRVERQQQMQFLRRRRAKSAHGRMTQSSQPHDGRVFEEGAVIRGRTFNLEFAMATDGEEDRDLA